MEPERGFEPANLPITSRLRYQLRHPGPNAAGARGSTAPRHAEARPPVQYRKRPRRGSTRRSVAPAPVRLPGFEAAGGVLRRSRPLRELRLREAEPVARPGDPGDDGIARLEALVFVPQFGMLREQPFPHGVMRPVHPLRPFPSLRLSASGGYGDCGRMRGPAPRHPRAGGAGDGARARRRVHRDGGGLTAPAPGPLRPRPR